MHYGQPTWAYQNWFWPSRIRVSCFTPASPSWRSTWRPASWIDLITQTQIHDPDGETVTPPPGKKKTSMIDIRPASHALIYCFFCCLIHGVTPLWPSITIPLSYVDVLLGRKKVCDTPSQKDSFITIVIQMMGEKSCTRFGMVTQNIVICDLHHLKSSPINIDKWDLWFMNGDSYTDLMGFIIIWPFMGYPMRSSPSQTLPDCQISPSGSINFSYWR